MSVVNQMLRDLEQSQKLPSNAHLQVVTERNGSHAYLPVAGFVLLLAAILIWQYQSATSEVVLNDDRVYRVTEAVSSNNKATDNSGSIESNNGNKHKIENPADEISVNERQKPKQKLNNVTTAKPLNLVIKDDVEAEAKLTELMSVESKDIQSEIAHSELTKEKFAKIEKIKTQRTKEESTKPELAIANTPKTIQNDKNIIAPSEQTVLLKELAEIQNTEAFQPPQFTTEKLQSLLARKPEFHEARLFLIQHAIKYRLNSITQIIQQSIEQFPQQTAYRMTAARYYFNQQDYLSAEMALSDINSQFVQFDQLLQMRALARQKQNKHLLAINDYSEIIQRTPNRGDIYLAMGISFDALGDLVQAKRSFQNALADRRLNKRQALFAESKLNQYQG